MNLQTEIRLVRAGLSEPQRGTGDNQFINNSEIVGWIYQAELIVAKLLGEDLLRQMQTTSTGTMDAAGEYDIPAAMLRFWGMDIDFGRGPRWARLVPWHHFREISSGGILEATREDPYCAINGATVHILPILNTAPVNLYYTTVPTRRYKYNRGTTTGAGTTGTLVDVNLIGGDDYWNACEALVIGETDAARGESSLVSDYTAATGTVTLATALSIASAAGWTYEMGQISSIPEACHGLVVSLAIYMGYAKDRDLEVATFHWGRVMELIQGANARHLNIHALEQLREIEP